MLNLVLNSALPGPPVDVTISDVTATSIRLSWSHPERDDIRYYNIEYRTRGSEYSLETINGIHTLYYTVRGLSPYTEYEFLVTANNDVGRGPPSSPATITTGETGGEINCDFCLYWMYYVISRLMILID
jgi:receptor-type tyrosine-protein phosphatase F